MDYQVVFQLNTHAIIFRKRGMIVYETNSSSNHKRQPYRDYQVLFGTLTPIYGGMVWYVLNVVQCGAKFIPIYMIYATLG